MENTGKRIYWIDELRGLAIWAMILYHIAFNVIDILALPVPWLRALMYGKLLGFLHPLFVGIFVTLSGICSHFSRRPLLRAVKVLGAAMLVTAATLVVFPEDAIWFGILHCLGTCMLFAPFAKKLSAKVPPVTGFICMLLLFLVTFHLPDGYLGFGSLSLALPKSWYRGGILTMLGFASPYFTTYDYAPLIPPIFLFFGGAFLGRIPFMPGKCHSRFLAFCGKHSLWIYLGHQPLVFGIFMLLDIIL